MEIRGWNIPLFLKLQRLSIKVELTFVGSRNLVFSVPKLVAFLSKGTTLEAGSLILTGTPSGVGFKRNPKIVLRDGDEVRIHIDQIGTLINTVRYEDW